MERCIPKGIVENGRDFGGKHLRETGSSRMATSKTANQSED